MRRRGTALLAAAALCGNLFSAGLSVYAENDDSAARSATETAEEEETSAEEGGVLVIWAPDRELRGLMKLYMPGYYEDEDGRAYLGEKAVRWVITSPEDGLYQDRLDAQLPVNREAEPESRIDLFVLRGDDTEKYLSSSYVLDLIEDLGMEEEEFSGHFPYLRNLEINDDGRISGSAVSMTPGVLSCRKLPAEAILGTSDPEEVQNLVSEWSRFEELGEPAAAQSTALFEGPEELYPLFLTEAESWVDDARSENPILRIDERRRQWAELCASWKASGYFADENTAGILFSVGEAEDAADVKAGMLMLRGPSLWCGDILMLACADGSDNTAAAGEVIRQLTCDRNRQTAMTIGSGCITNTVTGIEELQAGYSSLVYDGQNTLELKNQICLELSAAVEKKSLYDAALNTLYCEAMMAYIDGESSLAEAEQSFYENAVSRFPELIAE